ncbi:unnamed protein product [Schistosoma margrebowiei]|uniref:Uncharacterized protein n=1 Tax=Schistosoma margrebowiei TaxID=48269 RepID=A0A183MAF6_9TREM|nr:unnamed protein product [Schistosoma margrebowiei]
MTTDESKDAYNDFYNRSLINQNNCYSNKYGRCENYMKSMIKSNNEFPNNQRQEGYNNILNNSFKSFRLDSHHDKYELYSSDKNIYNYDKNEYSKNIYRSNSCKHNHTSDNYGPFTPELNREISARKSSKINHLVNLLYKNSEERNKPHIITNNNNTGNNNR